MNRNVESHFSELPKIDIQRSTFDRSSDNKLSMQVGRLVPFYIDEVLPGDTFKVKTSAVVRLQTPLTPIMSNIYMDTYYFFCPTRIVWNKFKEFMGESNDAWIPETEYTIPTIYPPEPETDVITGDITYGWKYGTIADYLGIPPGVGWDTIQHKGRDKKISAIPFRMYALICDQFFRDQNLEDSVYLSLDSADEQGTNQDDNLYVQYGGFPYKVAKYHDYFTSCLPSPQKGTTVDVFSGFNMGEDRNYYLPVVTGISHDNGSNIPIVFRTQNSSTQTYMRGTTALSSDGTNPVTVMGRTNTLQVDNYSPINLWADLGSNLNINDLRIAFQVQKYFEKNARGGTRYRELLKQHFSVVSSDARLQIPEYLGGHRFPLSIHQVANQSQGEADFLGDLGALSNTADVHEDFVKSFEEHGYVIGVCCVRYDHAYPQGLERHWCRSTKMDFYYPVFANLGETPVYKQEIFFDWNNQSGYDVFGYQECWSEYRYKPDSVHGSMRPDHPQSLASWHLADYYQSEPSLSDSWIHEDPNNVDRVLSVDHETADPVFADFYVQNICTRPMPMYSIPGLIDHH